MNINKQIVQFGLLNGKGNQRTFTFNSLPNLVESIKKEMCSKAIFEGAKYKEGDATGEEASKERKLKQNAFNVFAPTPTASLSDRKKTNVDKKSLIFVDFDCDTLPIEQFNKIKTATESLVSIFDHVSYPSFSYYEGKTEGQYRVRFIFELTEPLSEKEYKEVVRNFRTRLFKGLQQKLEHETIDWDKVKIDGAFDSVAQASLVGSIERTTMTYEEYLDTIVYHKGGGSIAPSSFMKEEKQEELEPVDDSDIEGALALQDNAPVAEAQSSQKQQEKVPFIEKEEYLNYVFSIYPKYNPKDYTKYENYTFFKVRVESDYVHGAIDEDTARQALVEIANGNAEWISSNLKAFETEKNNPSEQVLKDCGFRKGYWQYKKGNSSTTVKTSSTFYFEEKLDNKKVVGLKLRYNANAQVYEMLERTTILIDPENTKTIRKFEKCWMNFKVGVASDIFFNQLVDEFLEGKLAFENDKGTRRYTKEDVETILKRPIDRSYLLKLKEIDTKEDKMFRSMQRQNLGTEAQQMVATGKSFYSFIRHNWNAFQNGTVKIADDGTLEFQENHWDPRDFIITLIDREFTFAYLDDELKKKVIENPSIIFEHSEEAKKIAEQMLSKSKRKNALQLLENFFEFVKRFCRNDWETAKTIMAYFGMCFFPKPTFSQKVLLIKSYGGSGKSRLLELVKELVGEKNGINSTYEKIFGKDSRFNFADLMDKTVVSIDEFKMEGNESAFKNFTGTNGIVRAEKKGIDSFAMKMMASFICATNLPLKLKDQGNSMKRRLCILCTDMVHDKLSAEENEKFNLDTIFSIDDESFSDVVTTYFILSYMIELKKRQKNIEEGARAEEMFMASPLMLNDKKELWGEMDCTPDFMEELLVEIDDENFDGETQEALFEKLKQWFLLRGIQITTELSPNVFKKRLEEQGHPANQRPRNSKEDGNEKRARKVKSDEWELDFEDEESLASIRRRKVRTKGIGFNYEALQEFNEEFKRVYENSDDEKIRKMINQIDNEKVIKIHKKVDLQKQKEKAKEIVEELKSTTKGEDTLKNLQRDFLENGKESVVYQLGITDEEIEEILQKHVYGKKARGAYDNNFLKVFACPTTNNQKSLDYYDSQWDKHLKEQEEIRKIIEGVEEKVEEKVEDIPFKLSYPSKLKEETPLDEGHVVPNDNPFAQSNDDPFDIQNNPDLPF